ncbi:MAG TPA: conjugative transposon protein TraK [Puia sp.]|jgi:conjugative transposon TraK protein|nr:conjugative transposon protein TraK [Puia sp.]
MDLIKNIEGKIKLSLAVSFGSFITAIIICIISFSYARKMINEEKRQIYVLNNNIPLVATKENVLDNRQAEYRAHIAAYHDFFFSYPPDNEYIESQLKKAMYLVDASGAQQYNTLKEKGFFNSIVSTSSTITLSMDSISLDMNNMHWVYYGKEKIDRPSMTVVRSLVTEGNIKDIPRSFNNPHGALITNWKTIDNKDLFSNAKKIF